MKESDIRSFLDGDVDATWLLRALEKGNAATQLIVDLDEAICLTPEEMRRLCDAHLAGGLPVDCWFMGPPQSGPDRSRDPRRLRTRLRTGARRPR